MTSIQPIALAAVIVMDHNCVMDLIQLLHEVVTELLKSAEELDGILEKEGDTPSVEAVKRVGALLKTMCEALSRAHEILSRASSPLQVVVDRINYLEMKVSAASGDLATFLSEHRDFIQKSTGVSPAMLKTVIDALDNQCKQSGSKLDEPHAFDSNGVLGALESLRDITCQISQVADDLQLIWDPDLLRSVVKGVIGSCVIVTDVTAAASAPDVTGFVLLKAIKSTVAGTSMVVNAVKDVRSRWTEWRLRVARRRNPPPALP